VKLKRDPKCPVCGEHPTIRDLSIHSRRRGAVCAIDGDGHPDSSAVPPPRPEAESPLLAPVSPSPAGRGPARNGRPRLAGFQRELSFDAASAPLRFTHGIDLVIHEAGHVFALILRAFYILGAPALQVILPAVCALTFLHQRHFASFAVTIF